MVYEGGYSGKGKRFALVCARFNELIVNKLLSGARDALLRHETAEEDIDVIWVPGSLGGVKGCRERALSCGDHFGRCHPRGDASF